MNRRVAITGAGIVSPIGNSIGCFRESLLACRSGIRPRTFEDESWLTGEDESPWRVLCAMVDEPPLDSACGRLSPSALDPFARFALVAAREALAQAGVERITANSARTAVILGTAVPGDQSRDLASYRVYHRDQRPHPLTIVRAMSNAAVSAISMAYGFTGPSWCISSACASGTHAMAEAYRMVGMGSVDAAITGGTETLPSFALYRSWQQMRVLSPDGCRPFAAGRNGIVLGEGAAVVVMEPLEEALARGQKIYCEVAGVGMCADAGDWVAPDPVGMTRCMSEAVSAAGLEPADIAYINAHGTGTERGDAAEAEALTSLFGRDLAAVPVSSTKSLHGHALGASGAMEAVATALGLREGWAPAMPDAPSDPAISLNLVRGVPVPIRGDAAITSSFAFGGLNAALVLRRAGPISSFSPEPL